MNNSIQEMLRPKPRGNGSLSRGKGTVQAKSIGSFKEKNPKYSTKLITTLKKIANSKLEKSISMIKAYGRQKETKAFVFKTVVNTTLKDKTKFFKTLALNKIKAFAHRKKTISSFANILNALGKSKQFQHKSRVFNIMKEPLIHHRGVEGSMDKLNQILNPKSSVPIRKDVRSRNSSTSSLLGESKVLVQSRSISRIKEQQKKHENTIQQFEKIMKENQLYKSQQLSKELREAMKKSRRTDVRFSSAMQYEAIFKDLIAKEQRRLQTINQVTKEKHDYFDNELTITIISNQTKLLAELSKEIKQLQTEKHNIEKEERRKRQEKLNEEIEARKHKDYHSRNVERQMKALMDRIYEDLTEREFNKAKKKISQFLKKYEREDFAQDRVHFYKAIDESLDNYDEIEKGLDEVCKILQTLSVADLDQTDACLRSLKANHTDFNFLKTKYRNSKKNHGKKMNNITHNLLKFNDDIIKYLETKKEKIKRIQNDKQQFQRMKKKHEDQVQAFKPLLEKQRQKFVKMEIEFEKQRNLNKLIKEEISEWKEKEKQEKTFEKRLSHIVEKMERKIGSWANDFENLKKDFAERPFVNFFQFIDGLDSNFEDKMKKEVSQINSLLVKIRTVFNKVKLTKEEKFNEIAKILQVSGKKDPHLCELYNSIEVLMVTITGKVRQQSQINHMKEVQNGLIIEKKKNLSLKKENEHLRQLSQRSSQRSNTPPRRSRKGSVSFGNELETIEELIPKVNIAVAKKHLTVEKKVSEIEKILDNTSKKKSSTKKFTDLFVDLMRNIYFQSDDSPGVKFDRRKNNHSLSSLQKYSDTSYIRINPT